MELSIVSPRLTNAAEGYSLDLYSICVELVCVFDHLPSPIFFHSIIGSNNKNRPDSWILPTFDSSHHGLKSLKSLQLKMHCCSRTSPKPLKSIPSTAYIPEMQDMSPRNPFIHTASNVPTNIWVAWFYYDESTFQVAKFGKLRFGGHLLLGGQTCFQIQSFCNRHILVGMVIVPTKTIWLLSLSLFKPFNFLVPNRRLAA